nr:MAG TPA: hypothetical protein [Inoviridae sp.]
MLRSSLKNSAGHTRRTNEMQLKKTERSKSICKILHNIKYRGHRSKSSRRN